MLVGSLVIGFFVAVVCAYGLTEYLLTELGGRGRLYDGGVRTLSGLLIANLASFAIVWLGGLAFVVASGTAHTKPNATEITSSHSVIARPETCSPSQ